MEKSHSIAGSQASLWTRDFILIALGSLFVSMGFQMLLPVLPVFSARLGGSEAGSGLVIAIFTLSAVIIRPFAGQLLDTQGRKGVYLYGLLLFVLCTAAYQWVTSVFLLLVLRFVHGFGWGASSTASGTIASDIIPKARLGEGMGYFGLTNTLTMAVGPALSLWLMDKFGFGYVFNLSAVFIVLAVIVGLLITYHIPDRQTTNSRGGMIEKAALLPGTVIFFLTMSYGAIVSFIALYAGMRGIENIGLFFTVYAGALLISRPLFGRIADAKGYSYAVIPGVLGVLATMLILYFAHSLSTFLIAGFTYGIGFGAAQPALQAMAVGNVAPARRGAANATFFLGFDLGIGTGSMIWGVVAEMFSYQTIYLLAVIPVATGVIIYLRSLNSAY